MRIKKRTISTITCMILAMAILWAIPASAARILKYGHNTKENQPTGKAALVFADLVQKKTGGEIVVQVFPNNQLGNNKQMADNLRMGALDLSTMGLAALAYLNDAYMMMQVPDALPLPGTHPQGGQRRDRAAAEGRFRAEERDRAAGAGLGPDAPAHCRAKTDSYARRF